MATRRNRTLEDYPLFSFRTRNVAEKARLDRLVNETLAASNEVLEPHLPRVKKNQLLVDALERGLSTIRSSAEKRKATQ